MEDLPYFIVKNVGPTGLSTRYWMSFPTKMSPRTGLFRLPERLAQSGTPSRGRPVGDAQSGTPSRHFSIAALAARDCLTTTARASPFNFFRAASVFFLCALRVPFSLYQRKKGIA